MNIKLIATCCFVGIVAVFTSGKASAVPYELTFSPNGATISGGIVFDKSATDFSINSLISSDLTINGHLFSIGEIDFLNFPASVQIGVLPNISLVAPGTNDFSLVYNRTTGDLFIYSDGTHLEIVTGTTTFTEVSAVPGPIAGAGLPGLVMAVGGLLAWRRRKALAA